MGEQVQVHALVDDTEEAQPGPGQGALQGLGAARGFRVLNGRLEMRHVDRAGHAVHMGMQRALGFVERRAAGEHQVGELHQLALALGEFGRRALEGGQLVHAVVDPQRGIQGPSHRQGHGRVEPGHGGTQAALLQRAAQQGSQKEGLLRIKAL